MKTVLLVVRPFDGYSVGDLIVESTAMCGIQGGAHAHDVIQVMAPGAIANTCEEV